MTTGNRQVFQDIPGLRMSLSTQWTGDNGRTTIDGQPKDNAYLKQVHYRRETYRLGNVCKTWGGAWSRCHLMSTNCNTSVNPWDDTHTNMLYNKLAAAIRRNEFHAGKFLGESRQTVQLVTSTIRYSRHVLLSNLKNALQALRGTRQTRKLQLIDISDAYLKTVFGVLPLMADAVAAVELFEEGMTARTQKYSAKHTASMSYDGSCSPSLWDGTGSTATVSKKITAVLTEQLSAPRRLGLTDLAGVLWEVTPWSFLFDYWLPVGTYLDNLNVIPHLKGKFIITTKTEHVSEAVSKPQVYGSMTWNDYEGSTAISRVFSIKREVSNAPPGVPTPSFKGITAGFSSGRRILNEIALSHQQINKFLAKHARP